MRILPSLNSESTVYYDNTRSVARSIRVYGVDDTPTTIVVGDDDDMKTTDRVETADVVWLFKHR